MSDQLTVEEALKELQRLCPSETYGSIEATFLDEVGMRVRIGLRDANRHFNAPSLEECVDQVRAWKESQSTDPTPR